MGQKARASPVHTSGSCLACSCTNRTLAALRGGRTVVALQARPPNLALQCSNLALQCPSMARAPRGDGSHGPSGGMQQASRLQHAAAAGAATTRVAPSADNRAAKSSQTIAAPSNAGPSSTMVTSHDATGCSMLWLQHPVVAINFIIAFPFAVPLPFSCTLTGPKETTPSYWMLAPLEGVQGSSGCGGQVQWACEAAHGAAHCTPRCVNQEARQPWLQRAL